MCQTCVDPESHSSSSPGTNHSSEGRPFPCNALGGLALRTSKGCYKTEHYPSQRKPRRIPTLRPRSQLRACWSRPRRIGIQTIALHLQVCIMYGLKQLTVLSLMLLSVTAKEAAKTTMVGVSLTVTLSTLTSKDWCVLTRVSGWYRDWEGQLREICGIRRLCRAWWGVCRHVYKAHGDSGLTGFQRCVYDFN